MTETEEHNGWPEKYRDPRDRPHPYEVRVTVDTFEEFGAAAVASATAVSQGEQAPAIVSFSSVDELRKILTTRRIELLTSLKAIDGAAESITALAETLGRDYGSVHDDVTLLEGYGLVYLIEEGQAKRPYLPYERIHLDVDLIPDTANEEPAPA